MGQTFAIIIGIEKYRDPFLKPVLFAEADARAISAALVELGCPVENQRILINEDATATTIESEVRTLLAGLSSDDQCFIFFAGHGFSDSFFNYLAAHDSRNQDIEGTCVRLQKLLGHIKACRSKKIVLFLDACHTGIKIEETMRSAIGGIDPSKDGEFCAGFASCRADEKSYSSTRLKHGIWTYHLLEVLTGNAKKVLDGTLVTAVNLQKYLSDEVPRTLRDEFTTPRRQTPRFFGSFEEMPIIADLSVILTRREAKGAAGTISLNNIKFIWTRDEGINSLSGFSKRHHRVPTNASLATTKFVNDIASSDLKEHVDTIQAELRSKMKLKLANVNASLGDGAAKIRTPQFDYNVTVTQIKDDPGSVRWRHELANVADASVFEDPKFNEVFGYSFDTVEMRLNGPFPNIRKLAVDLEESGLEVNCPVDDKYCEFRLKDGDADAVVTSRRIKVVSDRCRPPRELTSLFQAAYATLSVQPDLVPLLPK